MIIHYNCDPRVTRRALRCYLRQGFPLVLYHAPVGRCALYGRAYVIPRTPRTPPQLHMRSLFGALAKDWFARLTPPQRDAWNLYARRIHRRWRPGRRTLTGQQAFVKLNSVLGRIGRPPLLWPPPQPAPFRPNPVQELRLRWDAGRLRLEVLVAPGPKGDFLVYASAPCSPGWSRMRRPVYLGLLPAPVNGISDITPLYLARFRAPEPGEQVFIQTRQHRHGWEGPAATHSALAPEHASRNTHQALRPPQSALRALPVHSPPPPCPHTACTREIPLLPAPTAPSRATTPLSPPSASRRACHCPLRIPHSPFRTSHRARAPPFPSRASVPNRLLILIHPFSRGEGWASGL